MADRHPHPHPGGHVRAHEQSPVDSARSHASLHHATTDAASSAAIAVLRDAGERVTAPRVAVVRVLAGRSAHLSAEQVATILESGTKPVHRATVYRTLERLAEIGVATSMQAAGGATVYHLAGVGLEHEHLHARCRGCGDVFVLPHAALAHAVQQAAAEQGFVLEPAHSTLVGLCGGCAIAAGHDRARTA